MSKDMGWTEESQPKEDRSDLRIGLNQSKLGCHKLPPMGFVWCGHQVSGGVVGYFPAAERRKLPRWATLGWARAPLSPAQRTEISRRAATEEPPPPTRPQTAKTYSRTFHQDQLRFWADILLWFEKESKSYMFLRLSYFQTIGSNYPRTTSSKDRLKDLGPGSVRNHPGKCSKSHFTQRPSSTVKLSQKLAFKKNTCSIPPQWYQYQNNESTVAEL